MRKTIGMGLVACLAMVFMAGCSKPTTETGQKTCPVMNTPCDAKIFTEYEGRKIYFCSEACKVEFAKNPKKYVKIVDAELKKIAEEKAAAEAAKAAPAETTPAKK